MKKMTSKKKYQYLKILGVFLDIFVLFTITLLGVLFGWDDLWKDIEEKGIANFYQWFTIVFYRLNIYLLPGFVLSWFRFDKRYKYISRLKIWLNWTLCLYLVSDTFITVFAIDKVFGFTIFNHLDAVVLLIGYVITFATKEKVSFDSTESIVNPKATK